MDEKKVLMILLDGAPFDVFFSLAKKGILPNLQKLMHKGCFNLLTSTIPSTSPVAIPSLLTGTNPGKHGNFGWGYIEKGIYHPPPSFQDMGAEPIWDIIGCINKKVILLNVPLTYPPFKINGIQIAGPPTPYNKAYSYPSEILKVLEDKIGGYYVDLDIKGSNFQGDDEASFIEKAYLITRKRAQAMKYLMKNYDWTFFFAAFTTIDRLQHVFFGYFDEDSPLFDREKKKVLIDYYKELDQILGQVAFSLDENTIFFIVSDHGFEYVGKYVGINNLLARNGFIKERSRFQIFTIENVTAFLERIGFGDFRQKLPQRILNIANTIVPRKTEYSASKCIYFGGTLFINENVFDSFDEVTVFKKNLIASLHSMTDIDSGEKIVEQVYERTDLYSGKNIMKAPHLIFRLKKGYEPRNWIKGSFQQVIPLKNKTLKTGIHHSSLAQKGIALITGVGIREDFHLEADIVDIVPTVLHILGIPILPEIDGQVLEQIFTPTSKFKLRPIKFQEYKRLSLKVMTRERVLRLKQDLKKSS